MEVVKYLKEHGLEKLVEEFAIRVTSYPEDSDSKLLHVLNYNQIDSTPKAHPIVMECRGLILDSEFNVVSRSFDRFFNLGEQPETQTDIDMEQAICFDKVDGSLIKIYNWRNTWYISTRGTAFAEGKSNGFNLTFKDLVLKALNLPDDKHFQAQCKQYLDKDWTYIFELTCMENRIVKFYEGYKLHYLAARNNKTYAYGFCDFEAVQFGAHCVKHHFFDTVEACIETAKTLPDLEEGYVLYQKGCPVAKIKSPAYCAVHLLRGEGLNSKRMIELILTNNLQEYLTYFPEDGVHFVPYQKAYTKLLTNLNECYTDTKDIVGQKDFAMAVVRYPFSSVLFQCRKNGTQPTPTFNEQSSGHKQDMVEHYLALAAQENTLKEAMQRHLNVHGSLPILENT